MSGSARRPLAAFVAVAIVTASGSGELFGQDPDDPSDAAVPTDSIQLVFEREVFTYPSFERRDPFRSLADDDDLGPRFEDMVLLGVILAPRPERSVAVLGARPPRSTSDQPATRMFRLRSGERVGNVRVIEIREGEVMVAVEDFGIVDTRMLTMPDPQVGSPERPPEDDTPADSPFAGLQLPAGGPMDQIDPFLSTEVMRT